MPEPFVYSLPAFKGRFFWGKFDNIPNATPASFPEVASWGDDAVLRVRVLKLNPPGVSRIIIEAVRPDPKTPGLLEVASEYVSFPKVWQSCRYQIEDVQLVEQDGTDGTIRTITVTPKLGVLEDEDDGCLEYVLWLLGAVTLFLSVVAGVVIWSATG